MNNTTEASTGDNTDWVIVFNASLAAITLLVNLHQSWNHRHLRSECFDQNGKACCGISINADETQDKPNQ